MTLTQLYYLTAIADANLNITQAAEKVHATQPGVSKQLRQLEDELGFLVFTRKGKSLDTVTPAGAQVIERARIVVAETNNIRVLAANLRGSTDGDLRIATTHTQARFVLPPAIANVTEHFPGVSVRLIPGGDSEIHELLDRDEVDIVIASSTGAPPPIGHAIPLYRWDRVVVVPHTHPFAKRKEPITLAALADEPLVSYESTHRPDSSMRRAFENKGFVPKIACTARDADLIKTYVRTGLGVGILAEMAIMPQDDADLTVLSLAGLLPQCTTYLLLRGDRLLRDFTAQFITTLAPQLDEHDLRRSLSGDTSFQWPEPPHWRDKKGPTGIDEL